MCVGGIGLVPLLLHTYITATTTTTPPHTPSPYASTHTHTHTQQINGDLALDLPGDKVNAMLRKPNVEILLVRRSVRVRVMVRARVRVRMRARVGVMGRVRVTK